MEAKDRIKAVLEYLNISGLALTKELRLNPNTIKQITGGYKHRIDEDLANAIVSKYNQIDKLWLLTGDGEMLTTSEQNDNITIIATQEQATLALMRQELKLMRESHNMMVKELSLMRKLLQDHLAGTTTHIGIASDPTPDNTPPTNTPPEQPPITPD